MSTTDQIQNSERYYAALLEQTVGKASPYLIANPALAEQIINQIDAMLEGAAKARDGEIRPPDGGLADLIGLGENAAQSVGQTRLPFRVASYNNNVNAERILGAADLYYIYNHECAGVFAAVLKMQELYKAGTVRLSDGEGARRLYQYDRREILRHTRRERAQAYRRVFGYTQTPPPNGAQPNRRFHGLFFHFMNEVSKFFRDKRVAEVVRTNALDPSFANIARVQRSGLNLRDNLKNASYGHVHILRIELMQLLEEAFLLLGAGDIRSLFGADNAWDVVEEVQRRYLARIYLPSSERSSMAITGRSVISWLAEPHVQTQGRANFEALLSQIANDADEWLISNQSLQTDPSRIITGVPYENRTGRAREAQMEDQREYITAG